MELSDLRVFQQVAESGGITRAAEKLNRVPSNVTARIQKLEEELGKPLFLREKNRLRISVAGEQLLGYSHRILDLAQQAVDELQQSQPKGVLNVGSMEAVAATRLVDPLMRFHQAYADVELNVTTGPTGVLIEKVLDGEIDMAFVADPSPDPRLAIKPVYKESLVLVSDLHHKPIKKPADLDTEATLLGFNHRCAYRTRLTDWLNQDGTVAKVVEISSYHALLSCAAAGMGVGILPEALLDDYPFKNNVQVHRLPMKWRKTQTAVIWRHDSLKASMEAFVECVVSGKT